MSGLCNKKKFHKQQFYFLPSFPHKKNIYPRIPSETHIMLCTSQRKERAPDREEEEQASRVTEIPC